MSNYCNGPGNVPRLPDRVIDTLIDAAKVSDFHPDGSQLEKLRALAHSVADELLTRLPAQVMAAVPEDVKLKYRMEGRAEALAILLLEDPESPLSDFTSSSQCGGTGEFDTFWDEAALRERFSVDDATYAAFDKAESAYWECEGYKDEAIRAANFAANMHNSGKVREVLAKAGAFDLMASLCNTDPQPEVAS